MLLVCLPGNLEAPTALPCPCSQAPWACQARWTPGLAWPSFSRILLLPRYLLAAVMHVLISYLWHGPFCLEKIFPLKCLMLYCQVPRLKTWVCVGTALLTLAGITVAGDGSRASSNCFREYIAINVLVRGHKSVQCCKIQVLPSSVLQISRLRGQLSFASFHSLWTSLELNLSRTYVHKLLFRLQQNVGCTFMSGAVSKRIWITY